MAKMQKLADMYSQRTVIAVQELAANGGIVEPVPSSYTTRDRVGLLINQIEFFMNDPDPAPFAATGDGYKLYVGQLFNNGAIPNTPATPGLILLHWVQLTQFAAAAGGLWRKRPDNFTFPEPKLVHPAALYVGMEGIAQAGALDGHFTIHYKYIDLAEADYLEIMQTIILQNAI